jgi:hypothetical protein
MYVFVPISCKYVFPWLLWLGPYHPQYFTDESLGGEPVMDYVSVFRSRSSCLDIDVAGGFRLLVCMGSQGVGV